MTEFLRQAASDKSLLVIKQTLYRTGPDSPVARALVDERANIELAAKLQEAGAHVVYSVVGHKTHAKMILVVRREGTQLRRYIHLGTGNYHPSTARSYADWRVRS